MFKEELIAFSVEMINSGKPKVYVKRYKNAMDSFKPREKDKAGFWIQIMCKFIWIEYHALRYENGEYNGTIEVNQDITELRQLKAEQTLLN